MNKFIVHFGLNSTRRVSQLINSYNAEVGENGSFWSSYPEYRNSLMQAFDKHKHDKHDKNVV